MRVRSENENADSMPKASKGHMRRLRGYGARRSNLTASVVMKSKKRSKLNFID